MRDFVVQNYPYMRRIGRAFGRSPANFLLETVIKNSFKNFPRGRLSIEYISPLGAKYGAMYMDLIILRQNFPSTGDRASYPQPSFGINGAIRR